MRSFRSTVREAPRAMLGPGEGRQRTDEHTMIEMVNGYPCADYADVSLARRGLNPENPSNDPAKSDDIAASVGRAVMPAVVFDGVLAPFEADRIRASESDRIRSSAKGGPVAAPHWRLVDITA